MEPKSFLSLDTEGRVIRLDSFSKVVSSGIRLGFITAAAPLIASIELHLQSSHLHAPTLSQVSRVVLFHPFEASIFSTVGTIVIKVIRSEKYSFIEDKFHPPNCNLIEAR